MEITKEQLADPWWRLNNLYRIIDDDERVVPFRPYPEQRTLYEQMDAWNLILKARRLGFTTFIDLIFLDQCLFVPNTTAAIIAHTVPDAKKIFRRVVRGAYERLPQELQELIPLRKASESELVFANGSEISVSTSVRSSGVRLLHVSEVGKIARKMPGKMVEIVTGSFPAVTRNGICFVESTAEGHDGWFFVECEAARKRQEMGRRPADKEFLLHFFPWWKKAQYRADASAPFPAKMVQYFTELREKHGITLDERQKAWYCNTYNQLTLQGTQPENMWREHPSYPQEAFAATSEGIILYEQMRFLRANNRIGPVPLRPDLPVNTFWDLGVRDTNTIILHQRYGSQDRFVKAFGGTGQGMEHWWATLEGWREDNRVKWGAHYLPHDGEQRIQGRQVFTRSQILQGLGATNVKSVPRVATIQVGIDILRSKMLDYYIDEEGCETLLSALDAYQYVWDDVAQVFSREPLHNWASHWADALRQHAQGYKPGTDRPMTAGAPPRNRPVPGWSTARGGY